MRTYTSEEKARALAIYEKDGLAVAARETGFNKATICSWGRRGGIKGPKPDNVLAANAHHKAELEVRRTNLRGSILAKAEWVLAQMGKPAIDFKGKDALQVIYPTTPAGGVRDLAHAFAVLLNTFRLEMGEATDRSETRTLTNGLSDHEKKRLRDFIDSIDPAESAGSDGAGGDPARAGAEVR